MGRRNYDDEKANVERKVAHILTVVGLVVIKVAHILTVVGLVIILGSLLMIAFLQTI